jgi:hypothetical protein
VTEYRTHAHECAPAGRPTDRPPDAITGGEDVCAFYYEDKKWSDRRTFISLSVDSPMSIIRPTAAHAQISKVPRVQIAIGTSTAAPLKNALRIRPRENKTTLALHLGRFFHQRCYFLPYDSRFKSLTYAKIYMAPDAT